MRARSATRALRARIQLPPSLPFVRRPRRLGKGLSLEYTYISCPTDFDTIYALKFTTVRGFLCCFSSEGHWASLEFTTPIAFEFVSSISSGHFP